MHNTTRQFLDAAKAAALLTPELFGGREAIRRARRPSHLVLDTRTMDRCDDRFGDRAFALMVQAIANPEKAESFCCEHGARLTPGRLLPTIGAAHRRALAELILTAPPISADPTA